MADLIAISNMAALEGAQKNRCCEFLQRDTRIGSTLPEAVVRRSGKDDDQLAHVTTHTFGTLTFPRRVRSCLRPVATIHHNIASIVSLGTRLKMPRVDAPVISTTRAPMSQDFPHGDLAAKQQPCYVVGETLGAVPGDPTVPEMGLITATSPAPACVIAAGPINVPPVAIFGRSVHARATTEATAPPDSVGAARPDGCTASLAGRRNQRTARKSCAGSRAAALLAVGTASVRLPALSTNTVIIGTIMGHREASLPGVTPPAVDAARGLLHGILP